MKTELIDEYATKIYAQNEAVGWWDDPNRCVLQTLQLVVTELAEATEGDRKGLQDDKLPHRKMAEVEIADTFIRLADLAGRYGWKYEAAPPHWLLEHCTNTAARHLAVVCTVTSLAQSAVGRTAASDEGESQYRYRVAMSTLLQAARIEGYDLRGAIDEKLAYNRTRQDHTRAARAEVNGKKY